jgi:hypothetical protein
MPNSGAINSDWRAYRTSVDQVEAMTGFDFFSNVPAATQAAIESSTDAQADAQPLALGDAGKVRGDAPRPKASGKW